MFVLSCRPTSIGRERGSDCVWKKTRLFCLESCGPGWSSSKNRSSQLTMFTRYTRPARTPRLSSTAWIGWDHKRHSMPDSKWINFMELIGINSYYQLQASRETVRCILDCFAHLFTIPEEVESAFLERAAKAFTQVLGLIQKMCLNAYMHTLIRFLLSSDEKHRWWEERLEACSAWFEVGRHERVWGVTQVTIPNWTPSLQREFIYISVHHQRKAPHISFSVTGEAWHRTEEQGHGRISIKVFLCSSPLSSD